MSSLRAVRGTYDLLPSEVPYWRYLENEARRLAELYGYKEIRTPMFEEAELFTRGMGVMAGIVERDLWTFHDKFGKKLALRADMTTSVVRAYRQHGLGGEGELVKLYYVAPLFLLGKDTEVGSRQVAQFGVEAFGVASPALDAEVIALASRYCDNIGLGDHIVELNTLGSDKCRPEYEERLRSFFAGRVSDLCPTCKRRYKSHPLWVLTCKEESCVALAQVAPAIFGILDPESRAYFNTLKSFLDELGVPYELNPCVLRDVEYDTGTVFRLVRNGTIMGEGGRHDKLVEDMGGTPTPSIGFALTLDILVDFLKEKGEEPYSEALPRVLLAPEGPEATRVMVPLLHRLIRIGIRAELLYNRIESYPEGWITVVLREEDAYRGHAVLEDPHKGVSQKILARKLGERLLEYIQDGVTGDDTVKTTRKRLVRGRRKSEKQVLDKAVSESKPSEQDDTKGTPSHSNGTDNTDQSAESAAEEGADKGGEVKESKKNKGESRSSSSSGGRSYRASRKRKRRKKSKGSISPPPEDDVADKEALEAETAFVPILALGGDDADEKKQSPPSSPPLSRPKKAVVGVVPNDLDSGGGLDWSIGGLGDSGGGKRDETR